MLCIDLTPLKQGIYYYEFTPDADAVDLDPAQFSSIQVDVQLDYQIERALVLLQASATATLECDRTLQMYDERVEGAYQILFAPQSFVERQEEADNDEEIRVLHRSDRTADLTEAVRDTLMLALPVRRVAPGVEDMDLQTVYGEPTEDERPAIDSRWEALRAFRTDDEETD